MEKNDLPWSERINAISINPDMATRDDIARMASELSALNTATAALDGTKVSAWVTIVPGDDKTLPETEGIYITKYKGDARQQLDDKMWIRSYPFWGIFKKNWIYKKPTKYSVTHWMPIPPTPEDK